jgi:hypothetical protein
MREVLIASPLFSSKRLWPAVLAGALVCGTAGGVYAFDSLFERVRPDSSFNALFAESTSHADVQDGFLIGTGTEIVKHLPDGKLQVERARHYTSVRRGDTGAVAKLPEPWDATSSLTLEPNLRLIRADTRIKAKRSGDKAFPDYKLSEHHDWVFKSDRSVLRAYDGGKRLQLDESTQGKLTDRKNFEYPPNALLLETVGMYLTVAVQRGIDQFDFDLLVPGGGVHGVRTQIYRTRDVRRFSKGYSVPKEKLVAREPLALVDMRLASPVKYLFFPHHFYMAFSVREPDKLMMMWGGDPDENLQAFRTD